MNQNEDDKNILSELWYRFKQPWCFSFAWHFALMIIGIGGLGIILSIINCSVRDTPYWNIAENIISYSLALIIPSATAIIQTLHKTNKKVSLIEVVTCVCIILPIIFGIISYLIECYILPVICIVLAWITWVIANYENEDLNDASFEKKVKKDLKGHGKSWSK